MLLIVCRSCISRRLRQVRVSYICQDVHTAFLRARARARMCQEFGIQRRYRQLHLRSSCISSSRSALRIHDETPTTIEPSASPGKYELHLARWFLVSGVLFLWQLRFPVDRSYSKTNLSRCCPRLAFPMCV